MPILCKGIVELVSLFMTLWLSVFLFVYVDWENLTNCTNEKTCKKSLGDYLLISPLSRFNLWNVVVILYCILFISYGVFAVWSFLHTIKDAIESKAFFEERLGISQHKLEGGAVEWDRDVVRKIVELQNSGEYRVAIHNGELEGLVIAQRILRKENFLIALVNRNMLDLNLPLIPGTFFSKSLEWSIYFCVLNYMFNHKYQVRPAFFLDPSSLKRRFMLCGIAHVIFMPFLLFFMTLHFGMQNLYDWKSTKQYMGPKEWSLNAKWSLREFNELPHFLERRLEPSYEATENYLKLFTQSEIVTTIGRILALVGGSLGAILLVFAAINDAILLHVKIGDWNLLWYVGMLGLMYSTGKAMLPDPKIHPRYTRNLFAEIDNCLAQVAVHTHYYPDIWRGRGWEMSVYKQVSAMFMYKAKMFFLEVVSVVLAPILLCVSLPRCAENICEFVMTAKAEVSGAGEVCGYATFDFDKFGDETWEGRTMGKVDLAGSVSASVHEMHDVEAAIRLHPTPKAFMGKMEKSFFSFKASHPSWKSTVSGQTLVDRLANYKEIESAALVREQQHHLAAAARQLETLVEMEQQTRRMDPNATFGISQLNESYLRQRAAGLKPTGGADSGGGAPATLTLISQLPLTPSRPSSNETSASTLPLANHGFKFEPPTQSRQLTPLPFAASPEHDQTHLSSFQTSLHPLRLPNPNSATLSVLHYADIGLSTELQRVLNRSTLDPDVSVTSSMLGRLGSVSPEPSFGHLASLLEGQPAEQGSTEEAERQVCDY
jgi:autophagy-related protein 9